MDDTPTPIDTTTTRTTTAVPMYRRWTFRNLSGVYRDRVSWGAIWGGLLTALGVFLLLSVLATAVGLTAIQQAPLDTTTANRTVAVTSAVIGLIAFFVGGFVAARGGGIVGRGAGALNGFLVWTLALVVMFVLIGFGVGQLFGALGGIDVLRQYGAAAQTDPTVAADAMRTTAWITFISMALAATAATLGGWLGAEDEEDAMDEVAGP